MNKEMSFRELLAQKEKEEAKIQEEKKAILKEIKAEDFDEIKRLIKLHGFTHNALFPSKPWQEEAAKKKAKEVDGDRKKKVEETINKAQGKDAAPKK